MPDLKTLKQLVRLMQEADLTELDIEQEGEKIKLKRGGYTGASVVNATPVPASIAPAPQPPATAASAAPSAPSAPAPTGRTIRSPMVGTFYSSPSPDAKPFVKPGDTIDPDTLICIIEAMKVFNEIKAETAGVIEKILVENGQAVEFDQPLFLIT